MYVICDFGMVHLVLAEWMKRRKGLTKTCLPENLLERQLLPVSFAMRSIRNALSFFKKERLHESFHKLTENPPFNPPPAINIDCSHAPGCMPLWPNSDLRIYKNLSIWCLAATSFLSSSVLREVLNEEDILLPGYQMWQFSNLFSSATFESSHSPWFILPT